MLHVLCNSEGASDLCLAVLKDVGGCCGLQFACELVVEPCSWDADLCCAPPRRCLTDSACPCHCDTADLQITKYTQVCEKRKNGGEINKNGARLAFV